MTTVKDNVSTCRGVENKLGKHHCCTLQKWDNDMWVKRCYNSIFGPNYRHSPWRAILPLDSDQGK